MRIINILFLFFWIVVLGCDKSHKNNEPEDLLPVKIEVLGKMPEQVPESSGLAVVGPDRMWTHNDSGYENELYMVDSKGTLLRTLLVTNVKNIDWEDLARDLRGNIYINDAGNNNNDRKDLAIYRISDPDLIEGNSIEALPIEFVLEDQTQWPPSVESRNFCIEAIVWHDDSIFMFTKDRSLPLTGYTKMYGLPAGSGKYTASLLDTYFTGNSKESRVTAADINFSTGELVLLTESMIYSFTNYSGNRFFDGDVKCYHLNYPVGQVEGISFIDDNSVYISEEKNGNSGGYIYRVQLR